MANLAEQKRAVCEALEQGETWPSAANKGGVSYRTVHRWCEDDEAFAAESHTARQQGRHLRAAVIEAALHEGAEKVATDPRYTGAAIFALKNTRPDEWRDEQHQHLSGANDGPVVVDQPAIRAMFAKWHEEEQAE
ncbi:MAG: hypothetical protein V2A79_14755 [Planctomycetota bacterium]